MTIPAIPTCQAPQGHRRWMESGRSDWTPASSMGAGVIMWIKNAAFCRHYVANGGVATSAARSARIRRAGPEGFRLIRKRHILEEIERLHAAVAPPLTETAVKEAHRGGRCPQWLAPPTPGSRTALTDQLADPALRDAGRLGEGVLGQKIRHRRFHDLSHSQGWCARLLKRREGPAPNYSLISSLSANCGFDLDGDVDVARLVNTP